MERTKLQPGKPAGPDQGVGPGNGGSDQRMGERGGDDGGTFHERMPADIPSHGKQGEQDLRTEGEPSDEQN